MTEQNEPSMEAILASIRNILAEDEETPSESVADEKDSDQQQASSITEETVQQASEETPLPFESEQEDLPAKAETVVRDPEPETEVMDLTAEMIVDEQQSVQQSPVDTVEPTESISEPEEEDDFTPEPVIPKEPMKEETLTDLIKENTRRQMEDDLLLAEPTVMAAAESLSHLRDIATEKQLSLGHGDLTIETIVRETLKPYLKEWLDRHLPEIVERVVKKEVAHIMDRLDLK